MIFLLRHRPHVQTQPGMARQGHGDGWAKTRLGCQPSEKQALHNKQRKFRLSRGISSLHPISELHLWTFLSSSTVQGARTQPGKQKMAKTRLCETCDVIAWFKTLSTLTIYFCKFTLLHSIS